MKPEGEDPQGGFQKRFNYPGDTSTYIPEDFLLETFLLRQCESRMIMISQTTVEHVQVSKYHGVSGLLPPLKTESTIFRTVYN